MHRPQRPSRLSALLRIALSAVLSLFPGVPVPAQESHALPLNAISSEHGRVTRQFAPSPASGSRTIVLIQDAHANPSAQMNIADILKGLAEKQSLRLILVEGGSGDVGLSDLRRWTDPATRAKLAGDYLQRGEWAGHEYLDVTSNLPLVLWGVEDPPLYEANVRAFHGSQHARDRAQPLLAQLQSRAEAAQAALPSRALRESLEFKRRMGRGDWSLEKEAPALLALMDQASLEEGRYPELQRWRAIRAMAESVDLDAVRAEQQDLMRAIMAKTGTADVARLQDAARGAQTDASAAEAFYALLLGLAADQAVSEERHPALRAYARYREQRRALDPARLLGELQSLSHELPRSMAQTPEEKSLVDAIDRLAFIQTLIDLKWTPAHLERHQSDPSLANAAELLQALPEADARQLGHLATAVDAALSFYASVHERNDAIVRHVVEKTGADGAEIAALILGGFHADAVGQALAREGWHVVVVTPSVEAESDDGVYHFWLKLRAAPPPEPIEGAPHAS